ncbi:ATP synthase subunit I [Aquabacterium sp. A7-Y]|uniref:ATP synthase subunit I n=1 Tax=Aquabacterium sp. A7-Y TaxID=1349605 RepID=UPI00223E7A6B|nr:ATP synthase subunit I [Aquabacterium sp. A7-Y]MCW7539551.1 ATP synthase subunit I [Aquabacterium sp. A7-Y]
MTPEQTAGKQGLPPAPISQANETRTRRSGGPGFEDTDTGADEDQAFKPLSREEAEALRAGRPLLSPWRVVGTQAVVGVLVTLLWWVATTRTAVGGSALYGAAATVLPGALMARGMTRGLSGASPGTAVLGFLLWEFVKIFVAVVMLVAAPKIVPDLHWPALLVTMIVCMKASWLALLWQRRVKKTS